MRLKVSFKLSLGVVTLLTLVTSCGSSSVPAKTVSYYQAHAKEREALFRRCADDPGALGKSAECVNVSRAEEIEGIGSWSHLAPLHFPPVPGATRKKSADVSGRNGAPSR